MHFMFFSAQYLPTVGGVERYTAGICHELIKHEHRVTIVTSSLPSLPNYEVCDDGVYIIRLPVIPFMAGRFPVLKVSREKSNFKEYFAKNKPDFCVIQTRFYTSSIMAARLCKKYSVPAVVIEHGTAHLMHGGVVGIAANIYEHIVCRYIYRQCRDFYGVSLACCNWLKHFGISTDKVLYNSVNPEEINALAESGKKSLISYTGTSKSNTTIVFTARFIPEKGVKQLMAAFKQIHQKYPDTHLVMSGDGPLWKWADSQKNENVILTGKLPYEENLALIKAGDLFILPTYSEGFASTVLEAAALKTVILTTPTGGSPQLILDSDYGILFPTMEEDSIFSALDKAISEPEWRNRAVEKAYRNLMNNFTWEKTCQRLISIAKNEVKKEFAN